VNQEIKNRWIDALRSGDYEQGKNYLCNRNGSGGREWCCLGVLTDLYQKETNNKLIATGDNPCTFGAVMYGNSCQFLPSEVHEWAGLTIKQVDVCIKLNDTYSVGFQGIAAVVDTW
jgi:hypothetical protein